MAEHNAGSRDSEAWRALYGRHAGALHLFARQLLATAEEAQDAVQEGFVKFWRTRERAQQSAGYLFACVRSAAIDLRRARQTRRRHERKAAEGVPLFAAPPEMEERRPLVEAALAKLPEEQREVVVLKVWSGLTFGEIGEALAIPANTAASRYRYAMERLQALLASEAMR